MRNPLIIVFTMLIILFPVILKSQDAQSLYISAEKLYEEGRNNECVSKLKSCKKSLGRTNPKIQSLMAMAYYSQNDYINAKISVDRYFIVLPTHAKNGEAYKAMQEINRELEKTVKQKESEIEIERKNEVNNRMTKAQKRIDQKNDTRQNKYNNLVKQNTVVKKNNDFKQYELLIEKGDKYYNTNNFTEAITKYKGALKLFPDNRQTKTKLEDAIYGYNNNLTQIQLSENRVTYIYNKNQRLYIPSEKYTYDYKDRYTNDNKTKTFSHVYLEVNSTHGINVNSYNKHDKDGTIEELSFYIPENFEEGEIIINIKTKNYTNSGRFVTYLWRCTAKYPIVLTVNIIEVALSIGTFGLWPVAISDGAPYGWWKNKKFIKQEETKTYQVKMFKR